MGVVRIKWTECVLGAWRVMRRVPKTPKRDSFIHEWNGQVEAKIIMVDAEVINGSTERTVLKQRRQK